MVHSSFDSRDGKNENIGTVCCLLVCGIVLLMDNCFLPCIQ